MNASIQHPVAASLREAPEHESVMVHRYAARRAAATGFIPVSFFE